MKILSLSEENVKKISALNMTLDDKDNLVIISGNNEQGKSSVLDGIEMALNGGASIPPKPVRKGHDRATVEMTLGKIGLPELTVRRVITATGGGSLVVTNADGTRMSSPQAVLDALVGKLSFDPLAFSNMKPDERSETLRQLLGLDFSKQEKEREDLFAQRTEVNRRVKAKQAMLGSNPRHVGVPKDELAVADILAEQEKAAAVNAANEQARHRLHNLKRTAETHAGVAESYRKSIGQTKTEIEHLQRKIEEQQKAFEKSVGDAEAALNTAKGLEVEVAALKDVNLAQFGVRISEVEYTNHKIRKNREIDKMQEEFKAATKEADDLTRKIGEIDRSKRDAVLATTFPVPGMTLGDAGEVLLDGLPFEQGSTKGRMMASMAMGAALNPKLRVLLVRSGNDLDNNAIKLLAEWADKNDMQIWLERISTSGKVAIIIEDGHAVERADQTPLFVDGPSVAS